MSKIIGLGGVFIKSPNKKALLQWYDEILGIKMEDWGSIHPIDGIKDKEYQVFSVFPSDTNYIHAHQGFMINWMVDDLDGFCESLKSKGIEVIHKEGSEFGKFAHIDDLDGNKIELWEPPK